MANLVKLKEVCKVVTGSTPKTSIEEYWNGDIKWITPAELNEDSFYIFDTVKHISQLGKDKSNLSYMPKGTVILSSRAPIGKTAITGSEMCCNQGFKNFVCSEKILNEYLYFFLKSKTDYLNSLGRGATFKEISKSIVENISIPLPQIDIQKEIASQLKLIISIIDNKQQQLSKLDELVKARFVEMFGDPITNSKNLEQCSMPNLCEIIDGDRGKNYPKQNEFSNNDYCLFLNAKNVTKNGFNFDDCLFISKNKDELLRKGKLNRGDIVLTTRGTLGNLAYYDNKISYDNIRINSGMVILRLNKEIINECFFIEQFKMKLKEIIINVSSGSAQPQLPISTMHKIMLMLPPIELQNKFAEFVEQVEKSKQEIQQSIEKLETLKKSLMQEYFG